MPGRDATTPGEAAIIDFKVVDVSVSDGHTFACYDLENDDKLIVDVAAIIRDLYLDEFKLTDILREAAKSLDDVCDEAEIVRAIDNISSAVIPQIDRSAKQPLHLQVPRNEVAEVLALYVLTDLHGYIVPASRIRNKEISGSPSRGLDVLGLTPALAMVLTEVKASSSISSPPSVVHSAADSMRGETLKRLNSRESLIAELSWALKHANPESEIDVAKSLLLHSRPDAPTPVVAPVLVRAAGTYRETDYGNFKGQSTEFGSSPISFVVIRLPGTIEDFAEQVYAKALEQAI